MAGTLTISTLSDGTNSTSATNCIQGSAKAWVNFNGTTPSIKASYNVSSVTRQATGKFTLAFTSAMVDANYSFAGCCGTDSQNQTPYMSGPPSTAISSWKQTTSLQIQTIYSNVTADINPPDISVIVFR